MSNQLLDIVGHYQPRRLRDDCLDLLYWRCRETRMVKACYQVIYGYQDVIMCHRDVLSCDIYINTTDAIDIS
jgi:hypothetical protein